MQSMIHQVLRVEELNSDHFHNLMSLLITREVTQLNFPTCFYLLMRSLPQANINPQRKLNSIYNTNNNGNEMIGASGEKEGKFHVKQQLVEILNHLFHTGIITRETITIGL
jgi:hypothetical protein